MSESATTATSREERRAATAHQITVHAQRLTDERGLDGFTLDDLAAAAGVSRRTLFNYFPGKVDAVLGPEPELPEDALHVFLAGGPTGDLVEDLGELARHVLSGQRFTRAEVAVARRALLSEPRLIQAAHARFDAASEEFGRLVLDREGEAFGRDRARLLIRVLVTLYDVALVEALAVGVAEVPLAETYVAQLRTLRSLLAPAAPPTAPSPTAPSPTAPRPGA
jgi:AcrR family transcriptional regulator